MPAGSTITYTVVADISASATGNLVNTATVAPPAGITDTNPANNSRHRHRHADGAGRPVDHQDRRRDQRRAGHGHDLYDRRRQQRAERCGRSDGHRRHARGDRQRHFHRGRQPAAPRASPPPAPATSTTRSTCRRAARSRTRSSPTSVPARPALSSTRRRSPPPAGVTDTNPGNNSATDTDTLTAQADLSITKTDGVVAIAQGGSTTYIIVVANSGPSAVDRRDRQRCAARRDRQRHVHRGRQRRRVRIHCRRQRQHQRHGQPAGRQHDHLHDDRQPQRRRAAATCQHGDRDGASRRHRPNPANNSATDTDTITLTPTGRSRHHENRWQPDVYAGQRRSPIRSSPAMPDRRPRLGATVTDVLPRRSPARPGHASAPAAARVRPPGPGTSTPASICRPAAASRSR